jgi:hypothetical protein
MNQGSYRYETIIEYGIGIIYILLGLDFFYDSVGNKTYIIIGILYIVSAYKIGVKTNNRNLFFNSSNLKNRGMFEDTRVLSLLIF